MSAPLAEDEVDPGLAALRQLAAGVAAPLPVAGIHMEGCAQGWRRGALIAAVPVRDEEGRIERCLDALDADLLPDDGVIVLANGCTDGTVPLALARMARWSRPWLLVRCTWQPGHGGAPLARRLALDFAHAAAPHAALLSVDGDTVVLPGLRAAYEAEFAAGFDLVCGRIGFLPEEAAALPPADPVSEAVLREYRETSRHLAALFLPDADNPWPHHGNIGGANFAIRGAAYACVGPLPTPPFGEDRALRRACEAAGLRIRYSDGPRVQTSCRLVGRTPGGLADELRRNRTQDDPVVDEALEAPDTLLVRLSSRRSFLVSDDAAERAAILAALGLDPGTAVELSVEGGVAGWQRAEDLSPRLQRTRLRLSDLRCHLPALRRLMDATRAAPSGTPQFPPSPRG